MNNRIDKQTSSHEHINNPERQYYTASFNNAANKTKEEVISTATFRDEVGLTKKEIRQQRRQERKQNRIEKKAKKMENKPERNGVPITYSEALDTASTTDFIQVAEQLEQELRELKRTKKRGLNKSGKKGVKHIKNKSRQHLSNLKNLKKKVQQLEKRMDKQGREYIPSPILVKKLEDINHTIHELEYDRDYAITGELSTMAEYPNVSAEQIKKATKQESKINTYRADLNKALKNQLIVDLFGENTDQANLFLKNAIEGKPMVSNHAQLYHKNSDRFAKEFQGTHWLTHFNTSYNNSLGKHGVPAYVDSSSLDWKETLEKKGAIGVVRKVFDQLPNLSSKQKNGWAALTTAIGLGYGIFKGIKRLFDKDTGSFWKKAVIIGGGTLATQAFLGENPISLIAKALNGGLSRDELKNRVSNSFSFLQKNNPEEYSQLTTPAIASLTFGKMTVKDLHTQMEFWRSKEHPEAWKEVYAMKMKQLKQGNTQFAKDFEKFGPEYNDSAFKGLISNAGVNLSNKDDDYLDKTIDEITEETMTNTDHFYTTLEKQGLKVKSGKTKEVQEYLKTHDAKDITIYEEMKKKGLIEDDGSKTFTERKEDIKNKKELTANIANFDITPEQKGNLIAGIELFYDEMPIDNKPSFELGKISNTKILMKNATGIDIELDLGKKILPQFKKDGIVINFLSYKNLIKTAYATSKILNIAKDKEVKSQRPFIYRGRGKGIYLDDSKFLEWNKDTRMLSTGWFGGAKEIAEEISKNPEEYVNYLNDLWEEKKLGKSSPEYKSFETIEDNNAKTKEQISQLGLSEQDAYLAQKACNEIYDTYEQEAQAMGIQIKKVGNTILFTSYGKEISIDPQKKTMQNLTKEGGRLIEFTDMGEIIKTANLINAIKQHCTGKTVKSNINPETQEIIEKDHPFFIDNLGNLKFRKTGGDVIIATGIHRTLSRLPKLNNAIENASSTLNNHKSDLVHYLNASTPPFWEEYDR